MICNPHSQLQDKLELFRETENVISWTSGISRLVGNGKSDEAIILFKTMLLNDHRPNYVTALSVIRASVNLGFENSICVIHGLLIKMGFEYEISVVTALLSAYSDWNMESVWKLFDKMPSRDLFLWNTMISLCAKKNNYFDSISIFREMIYDCFEPNHVSIVCILPVCADLAMLPFGKQIHTFSLKNDYCSMTNIQNSLLHMYSKCGDFNSLIRVFRQTDKDMISWRIMIHGCTENHRPRIAIDLFSEMLHSFLKPDEIILLDTIGASTQMEAVHFGKGLHGYVLKRGFLSFSSVTTELLQMYTEFGSVDSARLLFDQLNRKDLIAWSAMISSFARTGHSFHAINTFKAMKFTNEKPNEVTLVNLLQACSSMEVDEIMESIHAHIVKVGFSSNEFLTAALIDCYCKFGRIKQGKCVFDEINVKDLVCWSSMINGYGMNGYGDETIEVFVKMLDCGIKPNEIVFISVLSACSHCGLENEGWKWFYSMKEIYDISPKLSHYACMVDLLSRRGKVKQALEFVKNMPIKPDKRIWGALLAGCRSIHVSIDIAELVVDELTRLDPENTGAYVVLSNLYAEKGRWDDVERLRKSIDERKLTKELGYSLIEI
ncbi:pentatricopeptide repeat-containing protein DOT4, chloroplastic-like [Impatiens glandulifera]|uniref:pentatricopeptide repeat-containing protein DOT4, chloroplastic-like n=1 Tax=Impatiens glandulifera TaxID=253017 RepID=UPI001FB10FB4|nr:pentatricopeptide repeat-containing protein DOT4, chloroplastic-like [Impatiens glandulifera]